ncbi:DUF6207 family protein [Streptomyces sp. UMAF16]|nr:DUF6207 family protein [Streptomyces sp. UMAF16]
MAAPPTACAGRAGGGGARTRATAPDDRTIRSPGEPGVRLRCFLDLRQELPAAAAPSAGPTVA